MKLISAAATCLMLFVVAANAAEDMGLYSDHWNLMKNKKFLADNPKFRGAVKRLISMSGLECPAVISLWVRGDSPYGQKLEALCGPDDKTGDILVSLHYAIYPDKGFVHVCKPFSAMADCD